MVVAPDGRHHHWHKAFSSIDVLHNLEDSILAVGILLGKNVCHHVCGGVDLSKVVIYPAAPTAEVTEWRRTRETVQKQAA